MDESTWNAYHIVSNRVRAVCYNLRQQQFTIKTELSVNKLVQSTVEQIDAMKLLEVCSFYSKILDQFYIKAINCGIFFSKNKN